MTTWLKTSGAIGNTAFRTALYFPIRGAALLVGGDAALLGESRVALLAVLWLSSW
jgi:hypothetical protein